MKQLVLTITCVFYTLIGFSQDYKLDELKTYYWNDAAANYEQEETQLYSYSNGGIKETTLLGIDFQLQKTIIKSTNLTIPIMIFP